jgi:hypothetical protein
VVIGQEVDKVGFSLNLNDIEVETLRTLRRVGWERANGSALHSLSEMGLVTRSRAAGGVGFVGKLTMRGVHVVALIGSGR